MATEREEFWPKTADELLNYISGEMRKPGEATDPWIGYSRCAESLVNILLATNNYAASAMGMTGFQVSYAELTFLARQRRIENGFLLSNGDNLLYPQYDLGAEFQRWHRETLERLREPAKKKLCEAVASGSFPCADVLAHWKRLAGLQPTDPPNPPHTRD